MRFRNAVILGAGVALGAAITTYLLGRAKNLVSCPACGTQMQVQGRRPQVKMVPK